MKCAWLVVLVMVVIAGSHMEVGAVGECGKFSPERILTHVLRHCAKPARDVAAPVSLKCCEPLLNVPYDCLFTVIRSGAFTKVGVDPQIALTIPKRCFELVHH